MNIITNPLQAFQNTLLYFPEATAENSENILAIRLASHIPPLQLSCALDAQGFNDALKHFARDIRRHSLQGLATIPVLNPQRFSILALPLVDWHTFNRFMYEKEGKSCFDALIQFLSSSQNDDVLAYLGFAPDQIENKASGTDHKYFMTLIEKIKQLALDERKKHFEKLLARYPKTMKAYFGEHVTKTSASSRSDIYERSFKYLTNNVIGQDHAAQQLAALIAAQEKTSSSGAFLFVGPTGVGKTEMAKTIAKFKGKREVLFRMENYQEEYSYTKLFGSSPGFVGSEDQPHFVQKLAEFKPVLQESVGNVSTYVVEGVILIFDEFEKAHSKVKQSLLTLLDEKECTIHYSPRFRGNLTEKYIFKNSFLISTSNLFYREIMDALKQNASTGDIVELFSKLNNHRSSSSSLSPEMLARLSVIPFGPIPPGEPYHRLLKSKLPSLIAKLKESVGCKEIKIEHELSFLDVLEKLLYERGIDIRRLNKYFEETLRTTFLKQSKNFSNLENKKFVICCEKDCFRIKIFDFVDFADMWYDSDKSFLIGYKN